MSHEYVQEFEGAFWLDEENVVFISECAAEVSEQKKKKRLLVENNLLGIILQWSIKGDMSLPCGLQGELGTKAWLSHLLVLTNYLAFFYSFAKWTANTL